MKNLVPTESNRCFGLVVSGLGGGGSWGSLVCSLWRPKCVWLDIEEETTASNNWIGCNFKPFTGQTFVTSTKNDQLYDPQPPHLQNWIIDLLFKNKKICKNETNLRSPNPSSIWTSSAVIWIFFCFRKNYYPVVWTKQANHQNIA